LCTLLGKVLSGHSYIASTSDNPYSARTFLQVVTPYEGYRYMGTVLMDESMNVPWNGMLTRGMNEKGFSFTYSYVPGSVAVELNVQTQGSLQDFTTKLLTTCSTTNEAIKVLSQGVPTGATGNYLVTDDCGGLTVVEVSDDHFQIETNPQIMRTNEFLLHSGKRNVEEKYAYGGRLSFARLERGQGLLTKASTVDDIWSVLTDHHPDDENDLDYGLSICNHGAQSGTISAELLIPSSKIFIYRYGNPCGNSYEQGATAWECSYAFALQECEDGILTDVNGGLTILGKRFARRRA
jgi:hypothetical protein